jgi:hypothetical protein
LGQKRRARILTAVGYPSVDGVTMMAGPAFPSIQLSKMSMLAPLSITSPAIPVSPVTSRRSRHVIQRVRVINQSSDAIHRVRVICGVIKYTRAGAILSTLNKGRLVVRVEGMLGIQKSARWWCLVTGGVSVPYRARRNRSR